MEPSLRRIVLPVLAAAGSLAFYPAMAQDPPQAEASATNDAQMRAAAAVVQRSLDAYRKRDFEGWLNAYAMDVVVIGPGYELYGRDELMRAFRPVFEINLPPVEIIESGWTGDSVYVVQREYLPDGTLQGTTYAEYLVRGGKILSVVGHSI
ncbi:MAG: nuclear transport factor 2 family protein [Erythrobacter sp.]|jgi:ketosteroid isomerase-like protein|nr:nuclear transport factor 2 family protein [Erythrobacter sp.]